VEGTSDSRFEDLSNQFGGKSGKKRRRSIEPDWSENGGDTYAAVRVSYLPSWVSLLLTIRRMKRRVDARA